MQIALSKRSIWPVDDTLKSMIGQLADFLAQAQAISAPYDTQIKALETAKADALASLTWEIDTLKALLRPLVLAEKRTVKGQGVTLGYVHKEIWDDSLLRTFAEEYPAVLQCLKDGSYVTFRYRSL